MSKFANVRADNLERGMKISAGTVASALPSARDGHVVLTTFFEGRMFVETVKASAEYRIEK